MQGGSCHHRVTVFPCCSPSSFLWSVQGVVGRLYLLPSCAQNNAARFVLPVYHNAAQRRNPDTAIAHSLHTSSPHMLTMHGSALWDTVH